jgi:hypothetical protein
MGRITLTLALTLLAIAQASASPQSINELESVVQSKICPANLDIEIYDWEHCSKTYTDQVQFRKCVEADKMLNKAILRYNDFIVKCRAAEKTPAKNPNALGLAESPSLSSNSTDSLSLILSKAKQKSKNFQDQEKLQKKQFNQEFEKSIQDAKKRRAAENALVASQHKQLKIDQERNEKNVNRIKRQEEKSNPSRQHVIGSKIGKTAIPTSEYEKCVFSSERTDIGKPGSGYRICQCAAENGLWNGTDRSSPYSCPM